MITRHSRVQSSAILITSAIAGAMLLPLSANSQTPAAKPAAPAVAKDDAAQQTYYGILNEENVYIRSGPSDERYYATAKLGKGAKIAVVGTVTVEKNEWLKIIPPDGSYCYVAKAYVEKRGDGSVGRVTKADLNVRAGSSLNSLKTTVQTSLEEGDDVKITGEESDYFKITPPPGAYLWVKKTFVDPLPQLATSVQQPVQPTAPPPRMNYPIASEPIPPVISGNPVAAVNPAPSTQTTAVAVNPAPSTQAATVAAINPSPSTQAVAVVQPTADEKFDMLETTFLAANKLPLDQQPIARLTEQYTTLSADPGLPSSIRRIADRRVSTLKIRASAQKDLLQTQKMQEENKARQLALKSENDELVQRVKDNQITMYAALGTLRISSLQQSGATMYRLTDPGTGRTLLYIRSNDPKYAELLNKFIGVNGDITEDTNLNLKVISPKSSEEVDQAKVNTKISATVIPPSLLVKTSTASVAGN